MIKKNRISRGWSQQQLAEFSGLSVRTIQPLERGHSAGLEALKCIAAVLEVPLSELRNPNCTDNEQFLGTNPILPASSVRETAKFYQEYPGFPDQG